MKIHKSGTNLYLLEHNQLDHFLTFSLSQLSNLFSSNLEDVLKMASPMKDYFVQSFAKTIGRTADDDLYHLSVNVGYQSVLQNKQLRQVVLLIVEDLKQLHEVYDNI